MVSFADESGAPTVADKALILPPHSSFVTLSDEAYGALVASSPLYAKYREAIDRESAYEVLLEQIEREKSEAERQKELEAQRKESERAQKSRRSQKTAIDKGIDSMLGTISRSIGREIARVLLGSMKKRR